MGGACSTYVESSGVYRGKSEGNSPFGRPRHSWENNMKMGLQEVGCGGMDWMDLAEDMDRWWTLVNAVMNFWVAQNAGIS